jgi:hypothetical protein
LNSIYQEVDIRVFEWFTEIFSLRSTTEEAFIYAFQKRQNDTWKRRKRVNHAGYVVATGCNRTPDCHSWESRPLKKGIKTGGK